MSERALATGSQCPELAADKLRLYSMRFCPYAQRTRMVLAFLKIPHEVVNINLVDKPEWFFTKNPFGLVPVLEQNDKLVYESAVCDEYLMDVHGSNGLISSDPYQKARAKILMETNGKVTDKFYGLMGAKTDEDRKKNGEELHKALAFLEAALTGKYFGGEQPSILDIHVWPWFERLPTLEKFTGVDTLPEEKFPKLKGWVKTMHELPAVQATRFSDDLHAEFITPYVTGGKRNYDVGL